MQKRNLFFLARFLRLSCPVRRPAVQRIALHRAENSLPQTRHGLFQIFEELLDLLPLGIAVGRAGVVHDRQLMALCERADEILRHIKQRTDERDVGAVEVGHGLEARDAALIEQREHIRLDHIIEMVAEGDLVAACGLRGLVKRTAAHLRAQRTGVFLVADVENDRPDLGGNADVFYAETVAERLHRRKIHFVVAHFERDRDDLELFGIETAELRQRDEQGERVLAARNADRHAVAFLYHIVMVHRAADIREHFLHGVSSFSHVIHIIYYIYTRFDAVTQMQKVN